MDSSWLTISSEQGIDFSRLNSSIEEAELPLNAKHRVKTDKNWIIGFIVAILLLIQFLIFTIVYADTRRLTNGIDNCGNICGVKNIPIPDIPCSGVDYTNNIFFCINGQNRIRKGECLTSNTGHCFSTSNSLLEEGDQNYNQLNVSINAVLTEKWWEFLVCILLTILLSLSMLLLFRYATAFVVWAILNITIAAFIIFAGSCWIMYCTSGESSGRDAEKLLPLAITFTMIALILIVLIIYLYKKIKLVILLLKEATKVIFDIPCITTLPVITTTVVTIILVIVGVTSFVMYSSGILTNVNYDNSYEYKQNLVMIFTFVFNIIITYWIIQFIFGCQYMVIAGSISTWYFAKDKNYIRSPVKTSLITTIKFHLGTVALGSFILSMIQLLKIIIRSLAKNRTTRLFVMCCLSGIEQFLKFLSNNAYIETAIHGQSFIKSGKRAAKILLENAKSVVAINSIGELVLGMAQLFVVLVSTLCFYSVIYINQSEYQIWLVSISIIINLIVVVTMFAVFQTAVDTLFVCFCEDKILNDGISRPYYMTKGLMEFVENFGKMYNKK